MAYGTDTKSDKRSAASHYLCAKSAVTFRDLTLSLFLKACPVMILWEPYRTYLHRGPTENQDCVR